MKKIIKYSFYVIAVVLSLPYCNPAKKIAKAEDKAVAMVKNSDRATSLLKDYFFRIYPCTNDTITSVIEGETIVKIDTISNVVTKERLVLDTLYIESVKTNTITQFKTRIDTVSKVVIDNRLANMYRDSVNSLIGQNLSKDKIIAEQKIENKSEKRKGNRNMLLLIGSWALFLFLLAYKKYKK